MEQTAKSKSKRNFPTWEVVRNLRDGKVIITSWLPLLIFFVVGQSLSGQSNEVKHLLLQREALQFLIAANKEGIQIIRDHLEAFVKAKTESLELDRTYLAQLKRMNPNIKKHSKINTIISLQGKTLSNYKQYLKCINYNTYTHADNTDYIKLYFKRIMKANDRLLDHLMILCQNAGGALTDDQRMGAIDKLYEAMLANYRFSKKIGTVVLLVSKSKSQQENDIRALRFIYKLK